MVTNEPEDYALGYSEFLHLKIDLSHKPLIPRVETEYWTDLAIQEIKKYITQYALSEIFILDIFAGSGCIGLAVAKAIPEARITFVDSEQKCIDQAKFNATLNQIDMRRLEFVVSDVFEVLSPDNTYNFILANPPYIPEGRKNELDRSVIDYEPHNALFAGLDGLDLIKKFLSDAKKYVKPSGSSSRGFGEVSQIWLEFDTGQEKVIAELLPEFGFKNWQFHKDQYDRMRYVVISNEV